MIPHCWWSNSHFWCLTPCLIKNPFSYTPHGFKFQDFLLVNSNNFGPIMLNPQFYWCFTGVDMSCDRWNILKHLEASWTILKLLIHHLFWGTPQPSPTWGQAIQLRGPELRHAAVELRKDKEVVLQAVKQAGRWRGIGNWERYIF